MCISVLLVFFSVRFFVCCCFSLCLSLIVFSQFYSCYCHFSSYAFTRMATVTILIRIHLSVCVYIHTVHKYIHILVCTCMRSKFTHTNTDTHPNTLDFVVYPPFAHQPYENNNIIRLFTEKKSSIKLWIWSLAAYATHTQAHRHITHVHFEILIFENSGIEKSSTVTWGSFNKQELP